MTIKFSQILELLHTGLSAEIDQSALSVLRTEGDNGNAEALRVLGFLYEHGILVKKDASIAIEFYRRSADMGSAESTYNMGVNSRDQGKLLDAIHWWEQAISMGDSNAMICLAELILEGIYKSHLKSQAVSLFQQAVEAGNSEAAYRLGLLYWKGERLPLDHSQACKYFKIACENGHAMACYTLGYILDENQLQTENSRIESLEWFEKAAEMGVPEAIQVCGELYAMGHRLGVPRDLQKGLQYLTHESMLNNGRAQFLLAFLYATGDGVPKNRQAAIEHAQKSASLGASEGNRLLKQILGEYGDG